ncbi:MAG: FAD:protein FMN transferase [Microbacterium sp.]|uniref:FAD:protein FMN transferase n=1 Tax=Microbacterium sp. TaxID=51671 RepID=UPI003A8392C7
MWRFDAIGTIWEIETSAQLTVPARQAVAALIAAFDGDWSRFRDDSLVRALARGAGVVHAPVDAADMLDAYLALSEATDGAVNPLIGSSLERLGYDADYSLRPADGPLPAPRDWRERLAWADDRIALAEPALIDVGALGKGRLVDRVLDVVSQWTEGDVVVDAGGDLVVRGSVVRVALEHPYDPARAIATALFFDGGARLAHDEGIEWVRMLLDGRVEHSPQCPAELFTPG